MIPRSTLRRLPALALLLALSAVVPAQPESVRPGVNRQFENPDVERFINTFETESRAIYHYRHAIAEALGLTEGMAVADVGAGTGFFSLLFARRVGPEGKIYAEDIAENFVKHIGNIAAEAGLANVLPVLCTDKSTELPPASVDLVFVCDTYHHFEFPQETLKSMHQALRPGGRLAIIDFERVVGVTSEFSINHVRCGKGTVTDEVKDAGFDFLKEIPLMKDQYFILFAKRREGPASTNR